MSHGSDYTLMTKTNNEKSTERKLRVGLVADAEAAPLLAGLIAESDAFELLGQSGREPHEALPAVPWVDDARVLIAGQDVDAVVMGGPIREQAELCAYAFGRDVPLWRLPPMGRSFGETIELVRRAREKRSLFQVASWWEHVRDEVRLALDALAGFEAHFTALDVRVPGPRAVSWRSGGQDSGGSVLACEGYAFLEALAALTGLPESVSATLTPCRQRAAHAPEDEPPRETEDVVCAILRFAGGRSASIRACWDLPPFGASLVFHGRAGSIRLGADEVAIREPGGVEHEPLQLPGDTLVRDLRAFAGAVRAGDRPDPKLDELDRHVAVAALLESILLAARTAHPESPRNLYEVQSWPEPQS